MSKFNKKKFTGLDSVFEDDANDLFGTETSVVEESKSPAKKVNRIKAKGSNKNFTSDLDTLLEQALAESDNFKEEKNERKPSKGGLEALSGLDALIRQTINFDIEKPKKGEKPTKRVSFTVDKQKLLKLKQIARIENAYLKDIISRLISDYIKEYEAETVSYTHLTLPTICSV